MSEHQYCIDLGFETAATGTRAGIVLGLYRCRGKGFDLLLGWAEDFPAETASRAVATLARAIYGADDASLALLARDPFTNFSNFADHFRRAIALDPAFSAAWMRLASLLLEDGRYEEALPVFERATQLRPLSARMWEGLATAWAKTGRHDQAAQAERTAAALAAGAATTSPVN